MQSHNRFRLIVFICTLIVLAISTAWFNMVMEKSTVDAPVIAVRTEPDYFVDNFKTFKISLDKKAPTYLTGTRLIHYPADDSYYVDRPVMKSLDKQSQLQVVRADYARIEDSNSKVHLYNHVTANRSSVIPGQAASLASDYVLFLPNEDILWSDKKVVVQRGASTMHGVGAYANNATGELRIHNQTKVIYMPPDK